MIKTIIHRKRPKIFLSLRRNFQNIIEEHKREDTNKCKKTQTIKGWEYTKNFNSQSIKTFVWCNPDESLNKHFNGSWSILNFVWDLRVQEE